MIERLWHQLATVENGGGGRAVNYSVNHCNLRTFSSDFFFFSHFFFLLQVNSLVVPISH